MPARAPLSANAEGALWMLVSVAGATAMTLGVRLLSPDLNTAMMAFLRSALALPLVLPLLVRPAQRRGALRFTAWKLHVLRGVLLAVALNSGFYAIAELPMATATILFFLAPVFATMGAALMMGERVGPRRWGATALGFVGAAVILRPGFGEIDLAMVVAVVSSAGFASALLIGKRIGQEDGSDAVFLSSSVVVTVATLPGALLYWELPASLGVWLLVGVLVLGSGARTYADIRAYSVGDAGFLAPFTYLRLVTVGIAGYVLFAELPDAATLAGGGIIIGSTLYIALRERQLRIRPRGPKAGPDAA